MCTCTNPATCHRNVVADEALRREPGLRVVHLPVRHLAYLAPGADKDQVAAFVRALRRE
jgi:hypothetical protein